MGWKAVALNIHVQTARRIIRSLKRRLSYLLYTYTLHQWSSKEDSHGDFLVQSIIPKSTSKKVREVDFEEPTGALFMVSAALFIVSFKRLVSW